MLTLVTCLFLLRSWGGLHDGPWAPQALQQLLQRLVTEHQNVAKRADPLEGMPALSKAAPRAVSLDDSTQRPVCSQQPPEQVGQPPSM